MFEMHCHHTHVQSARNILKCAPLYIYSTQCCSHVPRLPTQVHITITYFLHFRSNNFNYFASKLPKATLS